MADFYVQRLSVSILHMTPLQCVYNQWHIWKIGYMWSILGDIYNASDDKWRLYMKNFNVWIFPRKAHSFLFNQPS